jgi:hypothetical protein
MPTLDELIERTITRMSMVSGRGTQLYAEDKVAEMIQHKFDVLFDENFWPDYTSVAQYTLDGATGIVTTDLSTLIKRFVDIDYVMIGNTNTKLTSLPTTINPFGLSGTTPVYLAPNNSTTRPFKVYPITATGNVTVRFRTKPATFVGEDEVKMDDQLLILGAVYDYLEDDASNPGATQKFEAMFDSRRKQWHRMLNSLPVQLDPLTQLPQSNEFVELP